MPQVIVIFDNIVLKSHWLHITRVKKMGSSECVWVYVCVRCTCVHTYVTYITEKSTLQVQLSALTRFWEKSNSFGNKLPVTLFFFFFLVEAWLNTWDYLWVVYFISPQNTAWNTLSWFLNEFSWGNTSPAKFKILLLKIMMIYFMQVEYLIR